MPESIRATGTIAVSFLNVIMIDPLSSKLELSADGQALFHLVERLKNQIRRGDLDKVAK